MPRRERRGVRYRIGQVIRHKKHGYRGVIVGWDKQAKVRLFAFVAVLGAVVTLPACSTLWLFFSWHNRRHKSGLHRWESPKRCVHACACV